MSKPKVLDGYSQDPMPAKKIRWACGWNGFGVGVWRSTWPNQPPIWTVCLGPVSIYLALS